MATTYPTTKQTIPNPTGTDLLDNANNLLDHDYQHSTENDTVEALQDKVGIDNDPNVDSFDYKLSNIASGDKAVSDNGTGQSITDITLINQLFNFTGDATGDMYYRDATGVTTRLPIGSTGQIIQAGAGGIPEYFSNPATSPATYTFSGISTFDADARYYAADSEASDSYIITLSPAPDAYAVGQTFRFKANTANTGAATININSLGVKNIVKGVNTTLVNGDIAAGQVITITYDGTNFVIQSPVANDLTTLYPSVPNTVPTATTNYYTYQSFPTVVDDDGTLEYGSATSSGYVPATKYNGGGSIYLSGTGSLLTNIPTTTGFDAGFFPNTLGSNPLYFKLRVFVRTGIATSPIHAFGLGQLGSSIYQAHTDTSNDSIRFVYNGTNTFAVTSKATATAGYTATNIDAFVNLSRWCVYSIVATSTSVLFYVDGVLAATHTTNIPIGVNELYLGWGSTQSSGTSEMVVSPNIISMPNTAS